MKLIILVSSYFQYLDTYLEVEIEEVIFSLVVHDKPLCSEPL